LKYNTLKNVSRYRITVLMIAEHKISQDFLILFKPGVRRSTTYSVKSVKKEHKSKLSIMKKSKSIHQAELLKVQQILHISKNSNCVNVSGKET